MDFLLMDFQFMDFQFIDYIVYGLQLFMDFQFMDFQFMDFQFIDYIIYGLQLLMDFQFMEFKLMGYNFWWIPCWWIWLSGFDWVLCCSSASAKLSSLFINNWKKVKLYSYYRTCQLGLSDL